MMTPQDPHGQQSPAHPTAVGPPPGEPQPATSGPGCARPTEVTVAFWAWVTSFAFGVLSVIVLAVSFDTIRAPVVAQLSQEAAIDQAQLENLATVLVVLGLGFGLLISGVQLLLAFLMRGGRNWARIVLAVIGGVSLLFGLLGLGSETGAMLALNTVSLMVVLVALVAMFLPGANPWFRKQQGV